MSRTTPRTAGLLLLLAALTGCTALVDGEIGDLAVDLSLKRDVSVSLRDFGPHVGQQVHLEWVENFALLDEPPNRAPFIFARATIDPAPSDCMDIRLRRGVPVAGDRVDFYADLNMNGMLDAPEDGDHTWRETLDANGELLFVHDVQFEDLTVDAGQSVLNPLQVSITEAGEHDGAQATVMLVGQDLLDAAENRRLPSVSALYVTPISGGTLSFEMPGVADPGVTYDLVIRIGDFAQVCTLNGRTPTEPGTALRFEGTLASLSCEAGEAPDCAGLSDRCDTGDNAACADLAWQCAFVDCAR